MSKRSNSEATQDEVARYGDYSGGRQSGPQGSVTDVPKKATAAQMATRKIAHGRGTIRSRGTTPNPDNPFRATPSPSVDFNFAPDSSRQNGTPNPFARVSSGITFGGNPSQESQQNGTLSFGSNNTTSFGGFPGSQGQPQLNSTSSSSFTFGAPPQTNGNSFTFGANKPQGTSQPSNIFAAPTPSQTMQNGTSGPITASNTGTSSIFNFGANATAAQTPKFGGFGQVQQNGTGGFSSNKPTEAPKPSFSFGGQGQGQQSLTNGAVSSPFGRSQPAEQTSKPNIFGRLGQQNGTSATSSQAEQASKPTGLSGFGSADGSQQTSSGPANVDTWKSLDRSDMSMTTPDTTPQKALPAFMPATSKDQPKLPASSAESTQESTVGQPSASKSSLFERITGGSDPAKTTSNPPFFLSGSSSSVAAPQETSAGQASLGNGNSLFNRTSKDPAPARPASKGTTNLFQFNATSDKPAMSSHESQMAEQSGQTPGAHSFGRTNNTDVQATGETASKPSLFANSFSADTAVKGSSSTASKPTSTLFSTGSAAYVPTAPSGFEQTKSSENVPALSTKQPDTSASASTAQTTASRPTLPPSLLKSASTTEALMSSGTKWKEFQELNDGFVTWLSTRNPTNDWSALMKFYLQRAAEITGKPNPLNVQVQKAAATATAGPIATPAKPSATPQGSGNLFAQSKQNPVTPNVFAGATPKAPATEPAWKTRTMTGGSVGYPKLPDNASNTAKRFEAVLEKPTTSNTGPSSSTAMSPTKSTFQSFQKRQSPDAVGDLGASPSKKSTFTPASTSAFTGKSGAFQAEQHVQPPSVSENNKPSGSNLFTPSALKRKSPPLDASETPAAKKAAFTPSTSSIFAPKPSAPAAAATTGFNPTGPAPGAPSSGGFLSAFGSKAKEQEDKAKKQARDEEFDSEEDDADEWERQYEEKQEQKRKAHEEAAKATKMSGFKPSPAAAATVGFTPAASAASVSSSGGFLSAFESKAKQQEEKAKQQARDEEFDSEEDDAEEWDRQYQEKQEQKRKAHEETTKAATTTGFKPAASLPANPSPSIFKLGSATSTVEEAADETPKASHGLFDRIKRGGGMVETPAKSSNLFSDSTGTAPATTPNFAGLFSKDTNAADHTWKQGTPLKFGESKSLTESGDMAITPAVSGTAKGNTGTLLGTNSKSIFDQAGSGTASGTTGTLFGAGANTKSIFDQAGSGTPKANTGTLFGSGSNTTSIFDLTNSAASTPKPSGFMFGRPGATAHLAPASALSRATTPGMTTDGETSNVDASEEGGEGEPSDAAPAEEVEDKSELTPDERADHEVLVELPKALVWKLAKTPTGAQEWREKGRGPLYVLKSKETGRVRILMKIAPLGKLAMNFEPLKKTSIADYKVMAEKPKYVLGQFFDHLEAPAARGVANFRIFVVTEENAKSVVKYLKEGQPD